jgi:hypothetical protein
MLIWNIIRYHFYKRVGKRTLKFSLADFIDQGIGLEVRSKKYNLLWQPHLNKCKDFILKALDAIHEKNNVKHILVLGAGRLNDFPFQQILNRNIKITLVDIDPSNISSWSKLQRKYPKLIEWHIADVTGRFESWSKQLKQSLNLADPFLKTTRTLNPLFEEKFDFVISLNLLSQLGVFWCDRVIKALNKRSELEKFIEETSLILEQEHIDLLQRVSKHAYCLIADELFHYYLPDKSHWQSENACQVDRNQDLENFTRVSEDCWLWHLRPAGSEGEKYGEIHRVLAQLFVAKSA